MATKRMMTKKVTDDDGFVSLSSSAQALYLHLSMSADDDGFSCQVTTSMFKAHASVQDLQALLEKRYIYQFENGVIVIKHWRMANSLRKDRYTETIFREELAKLAIEDNGSYSWLPDGCQMVAERLPDGCQMVATDKDRLDKIRLDKSIERVIDKGGVGGEDDALPSPKKPKEARHRYGQYANVLLSDAELDRVKTEFPADWEQRIERLSEYIASSGKSYKNHVATIRAWARRDRKQSGKKDRSQTERRSFRGEQDMTDDVDIVL